MTTDSFTPSYLEAKRSVDDRAIDLRVWRELGRRAASLAETTPKEFSVLEVGAGTGAMIDRLSPSLELATQRLRYVALEPDATNAVHLRARFPNVEVIERSFFDYAASAIERAEQWHLIVACAVLDLLPLVRASRTMAQLLSPGGLVYLPICFDGVTAFEPAIDPALEREIERHYHSTMEQRQLDGETTGGALSGRRLFGTLRKAGLEIVAAGSSDWVVFADGGGRYPEQEALFLQGLVDTIEAVVGPKLGAEAMTSWAMERRAQIERGELVYIAHQLDLLAVRS